ncbi:MAG TPA: UbiA family prenyltransferase [Lapillicoccus sp.]|nr:UbiA family prenyltransferase [Lapillicoccus sp.]
MTTPTGARTGHRMPLLRAAHIGPAVAVTLIVALLAVGEGLPRVRAVVVTAAVFTGQLTIGWGNDLIDARRDRDAGRRDKPLATGELTSSVVRTSLVLAAIACVVLSVLVGWRSALVHLGLGVSSGHLYNVALKGSAWSWLPYATAFGTLPAVVTLADIPPSWPPLWMLGTAAAIGVAAHLLNALPDLDDDLAAGLRGLPHRLGPTPSRLLATGLLVCGSVVAIRGSDGMSVGWGAVTLAVVLGLAGLALLGRGRVPFAAAIGIALVDVVLLTVVSIL